MPLLDLPLPELLEYRSATSAPSALADFWRQALASARASASEPMLTRYEPATYGALTAFDVTFSGADGHPIRAWYLRPAEAGDTPLACRVTFIGYGGGRDLPAAHALYPACGYAAFVMDTRAQGGTWAAGDTADRGAGSSGPEHPGVMSRGIATPETYYYRRLYADVITSGAFWRQIGNSTIVAAIATVLVVGVSALAAYPLSRMRFRGREAIYTFFTFGLLFPVAVAALPLYLLLRQLGLLESLLGVALPEAAFGIPITIIILRPFMRSIPVELEDAAAVDGCGRLGFFWRILLPLSRPALVTVIVLSVVTSWNNYILPFLILNDPNHWTLPLGVATYSGVHSADTAGILAFTTLSIVPALLFFMAAERRIVGGLSGAVKG